MNRVAIAGKTASGKTTAANHLIENHGFVALGFADPLYELGEIHAAGNGDFAGHEFGLWDRRVFAWSLRHLKPIGLSLPQRVKFQRAVIGVMAETPILRGKNRTLLQKLGTEVGRGFDPDLWVKIFAARVEALGPDARIVNPNLRFPNECDAVLDMDFVVLYLDVPPGIQARRYEKEYGVALTGEQATHESESYLPTLRERADFVYENTGSVEELREAVSLMLQTKAVTG